MNFVRPGFPYEETKHLWSGTESGAIGGEVGHILQESREWEKGKTSEGDHREKAEWRRKYGWSLGTKRTTCFFSSSEKDIIIHPIAQPRNQGNMGASFHSLILYISSVSKGISAAF